MEYTSFTNNNRHSGWEAEWGLSFDEYSVHAAFQPPLQLSNSDATTGRQPPDHFLMDEIDRTKIYNNSTLLLCVFVCVCLFVTPEIAGMGVVVPHFFHPCGEVQYMVSCTNCFSS